MEIEPEDIVQDEDNPPCIDIVRDETEELFRFCIYPRMLDLNSDAADLFDSYRELEAEASDEHEGCVLLVKGDRDESFWYLFRTDSGEIGLFSSEYSMEDDDDEDDDEEEDGEGIEDDKENRA